MSATGCAPRSDAGARVGGGGAPAGLPVPFCGGSTAEPTGSASCRRRSARPRAARRCMSVAATRPSAQPTPAGSETVGRDPGFARVRWDAAVDVPVTTLDRLIDRFGEPAYCKIDVEGSEAAVLAGSGPAPAAAQLRGADRRAGRHPGLSRPARGTRRLPLQPARGGGYGLCTGGLGRRSDAAAATGPGAGHVDVHARLAR